MSERFARQLEDVEHERVPAGEGDSGEIEVLPDGSVSIPLFEEELVVTRRTVLRERVIVRKQLVDRMGDRRGRPAPRAGRLRGRAPPAA